MSVSDSIPYFAYSNSANGIYRPVILPLKTGSVVVVVASVVNAGVVVSGGLQHVDPNAQNGNPTCCCSNLPGQDLKQDDPGWRTAQIPTCI